MLKRLGCILLASAVALPAAAQTPPAQIGASHVPAPWWMREPVIAAIGHVRVELEANRANFSASFQSIDRNAPEASARAADQVRALSQALAGYGVDRVRVETTVSTRPLYEQYRDETGVLRDNPRADRIQRYQADATVSIAVRDVSVLEQVYAAVTGARPTSVSTVHFSLQPDNTTLTNLAGEAVRDAARRARAAAENAGATLGRVRVIDPSGRACQTDVLAGWPSYGSAVGPATTVDAITVTGSRLVRREFEAISPITTVGREQLELTEVRSAEGLMSEQAGPERLTLQPPIRVLTDQACVVYGLN